MRHLSIADAIQRHLAAEEFEEAEALLPRYACAVTEECVEARDEAAFKSARDFLHRAIVDLRARRMHLSAQIADLQQTKPYLTPSAAQAPSFDWVG